jgi:hypothetical protein
LIFLLPGKLEVSFPAWAFLHYPRFIWCSRRTKDFRGFHLWSKQWWHPCNDSKRLDDSAWHVQQCFRYLDSQSSFKRHQ